MNAPALVPPVATYRLQFTPDFRFADARAVAPYLRQLGISHVYASPITRARHGSAHGYDVCDPREVNPQLGTPAELLALLVAVRDAGMGWIQDIVPNHMAASVENPCWLDVLRHGRASRWADVFDIDWDHPELDGRIQLPVLPEPYGTRLAAGRLTVHPGDDGPWLDSGGLRLPLCPGSLPVILGEDPACAPLVAAVVEAGRCQDPDQRDRLLAAAWTRLDDPAVRAGYTAACAGLAGPALDRVLQVQPWRLAWFRTGREMVGYRRFFAIDDLVAVRIEDDRAFELMHGLAFTLAAGGLIEGVRVDHVDGLRDPHAYLNRLRQRLPRSRILVEKILAADEQLPADWPVCGTTGYDFLGRLLPACCSPTTAERSALIHRRLTGQDGDPRQLRIRLREQVGRLGLAGDADRVARLIRATHPLHPAVRDLAPGQLRQAAVAISARLPLYRTYGLPRDQAVLTLASQQAAADHPGATAAIGAVRDVLVAGLEAEAPPAVREALLRFQQFTGPVMAKGCEDTFFYAFTRQLGLNEVGGDPLLPPIAPGGFIAFAAARGAAWPTTLNATATHDTKRGEDTRARLAALTWHPARWERFAGQWIAAGIAGDQPHPDDRYALLQTLVATWPESTEPDTVYMERVQAYALKALREAGQRTSWIDPDGPYEERVAAWLATLCAPTLSVGFHQAMHELLTHVVPHAQAIGLAMTVLKCTLPGVPDIYQGCEWPDLSLVDPDNRRPVDFTARATGLLSPEAAMPAMGDPRCKQAVLQRCLRARRADPALWTDTPVTALPIGGIGDGLFAFTRGRFERLALVLADVGGSRRDAVIALPSLPAGGRWLDLLTRAVFSPGSTVPVPTLLATLPCALLVPADGDPLVPIGWV